MQAHYVLLLLLVSPAVGAALSKQVRPHVVPNVVVEDHLREAYLDPRDAPDAPSLTEGAASAELAFIGPAENLVASALSSVTFASIVSNAPMFAALVVLMASFYAYVVGGSKEPRHWRAVVVVSLIGAYALLVPGLLATLITYDVAGMGAQRKSIVGTVTMLFDAKAPFAACLILLYSVIVPFVKLSVLLAYALTKKQSLVAPVQWISKWATTDAFVVCFMAVLLKKMSGLTVEVGIGFFCFALYCIISTLAALLIPTPSISPVAAEGGFVARNSRLLSHMHGVAFFALAGAGLFTRLMSITIPLMDASAHTSLAGAVWRLGTMEGTGEETWVDLRLAAHTLSIFAFLVPCVEAGLRWRANLVGAYPRWEEGKTGKRVGHVRCLLHYAPHLAMLDVMLLAVLVACLAINGTGLMAAQLGAPGFSCLLAAVCVQYSQRMLLPIAEVAFAPIPEPTALGPPLTDKEATATDVA